MVRKSTYTQLNVGTMLDMYQHSILSTIGSFCHIMASLGFPEAAIRNIKSIYTNATTVIATPFGDTGAVHIGRGTIQGDTLSPYLFLIFIEPLLRWLQQGGRGYAPGCLAETQFPKTIAALAYADDLNALTSSLSNLKLQAQKVERFAQWSGMEVNARKCAASAILHGQAAAGAGSNVRMMRE